MHPRYYYTNYFPGNTLRHAAIAVRLITSSTHSPQMPPLVCIKLSPRLVYAAQVALGKRILPDGLTLVSTTKPHFDIIGMWQHRFLRLAHCFSFMTVIGRLVIAATAIALREPTLQASPRSQMPVFFQPEVLDRQVCLAFLAFMPASLLGGALDHSSF